MGLNNLMTQSWGKCPWIEVHTDINRGISSSSQGKMSMVL
jgi:hypothetical protein